jgi:peptidoglycan/LPS O-acetylase OafA/YrhL
LEICDISIVRNPTPEARGTGRSGAYIPSLDGWRSIAIFAVILSHNHILRLGPFADSWVHDRGGRGVDLFFALSGILICSRLIREELRFGTISFRSFYTRRIFRIQPAALTYLSVVCLLIFSGELLKLDSYKVSPWPTVLASLLMVRNIFTKTFFFETAHFWSLSVEEQFYIFLPLFLVLCKRYRISLLSLLLLAAYIWRIVYLSTAVRPARVFQRTDLVCAPLLIGCIFALALSLPKVKMWAQKYLPPWIAILYAILIFLATELHHSRADYSMVISMYPVLIAATMLHSSSWTTRFLELPPMQFIGRISYSLYLWQELFFDPYSPAGARRSLAPSRVIT